MKKASGFTLVELIIVILIIAILAAISLVTYNSFQDRAFGATNISNLKSIQRSIEAFRAVNGTYPATSDASYQRCSGDNFIPGLVPNFVTKLPSVGGNQGAWCGSNTYFYFGNENSYSLCYLDQAVSPARGYKSINPLYRSGDDTDRYGVWSSNKNSC